MLSKAQIQLIKSLSDKKMRRESGLFVVEGRKMVSEAVASKAPVEKIYVTGEDAVKACLGFPASIVEYVSGKEMERMSHLKSSADVLALVRMPDNIVTDGVYGDGRLVLFLDGVQDPGNMGTIIRIADWFGIEEIVCSLDSADCFNPKTVQATMGALFRVQIHYARLPELLEAAYGTGIPIYGTFLEGVDIYSTKLSSNGIIVMGSEGRGISDDISRLVTRKLFIPPYPADRCGSESLNVAVATAVICSEFRRR